MSCPWSFTLHFQLPSNHCDGYMENMLPGDSVSYFLKYVKIIETHPREIGFVLWCHCQNLLDDPHIIKWCHCQNLLDDPRIMKYAPCLFFCFIYHTSSCMAMVFLHTRYSCIPDKEMLPKDAAVPCRLK